MNLANRLEVGVWSDMAGERQTDELRFAFGENWRSFLAAVDDERIETATGSLKGLLGVSELTNRRFLDVGSGSGLFSLAARRLGARVHSFDYDISSVECTEELRRRYRPGDIDWTIERASILDRSYLDGLG